MIDRMYVTKAAGVGAGKASLLQEDPLRYMLRAVGAGMGLTVVVFVFWVLKDNLHDISIGADRIRLFRRRPYDYRLHEHRAVHQ
jgi:nitrite transporter